MTDLPVVKFIEETIEEDGSSLATFEVDEAAEKLCSEIGLRFIVTCAFYNLDLEDAFRAVSDRGKYLQQEPDEQQ